MFHLLPRLGHSAFLLFFSHFVLLFGAFPFDVLSELDLQIFAKLCALYLHMWYLSSFLNAPFLV